MNSKSAIHISDIQPSDSIPFGSPYWVDTKPNKKFTIYKIFQQIWKWAKVLIFLFMMLMGLWGCFQTMIDPKTLQNPSIGMGLEYGFPFGTTCDFRFDLQMHPDASQYNSFIKWSCQAGDAGYGPFYGLFVWPFAWTVNNFIYVTRNWVAGLNVFVAIFLLLLIIRLLTLAISFKSTFQNERMSEIQSQVAQINAKYKDLNDMQSKQMKQKEIMDLYKKNNIKPLAAFSQMFLTLPIFLIVYKIITIVRPIKVTNLFNIWNFASTPTSQIFSNFTNGGWTYIFFLFLVITAQIASMLFPKILAKKRTSRNNNISSISRQQAKKNDKTQYIFMGVMCIMVIFSAVGVGVYWFLNSLFAMLQSWVIHLIILQRKQNPKSTIVTDFKI